MRTNYLIVVHVLVVCYNNFVTLPQNVTFITVVRQFAHISGYLA
jgi:hypothetical protein